MIRVGIGGWTYEPWRGPFYPAGLKQADELRFAGERVTSIEINGTFYRTQSAASFAKWRDETPDGFVFSVKGHRAIVNKKALAESGEAIDWFYNSGILALGDKLGPVLWQFAPYRKFDAEAFDAFFTLLPAGEGRAGRCAMSSRCGTRRSLSPPSSIFSASTRSRSPMPTPTSIRRSPTSRRPSSTCGSSARARRFRAAMTPPISTAGRGGRRRSRRAVRRTTSSASIPKPAAKKKRDVFVYMIAGAKVRAPAAAMALIERVR